MININQKIKETEVQIVRLAGLIAKRKAIIAQHPTGLSAHDDRRLKGDLANLEELFEQEKTKLADIYIQVQEKSKEKSKEEPTGLLQRIKRTVKNG